MILVLLGTNPYSFRRLASAVDELAGANGLDVFMQLGNTEYRPKHCRSASFIPIDEIRRSALEAEMLITQGGVGSIREGLAAGKPVIAVPRRPDLAESQDKQEDLVRALECEGRVIAVYDIGQLGAAIERARHFCPPPLRPCNIGALIGEFLASC